jgi:hypothetical protein
MIRGRTKIETGYQSVQESAGIKQNYYALRTRASGVTGILHHRR